MVGIVAYGGYVPRYRLTRDEIARAWGANSPGGEKAVANHDEDSLTLAVEATLNCLQGFDPQGVGSLFFASTTFPYLEKQSASLIAAVAETGERTRTADFSNSLRAGTNALISGIDAIKGGSVQQALVVAADCRQAEPESSLEQSLGDGAAALLLGESGVIAKVIDSVSLSSEFTNLWRKEDDPYVRSLDQAFAGRHGYTKMVRQTVGELLQRNQLKPTDLDRAVLFAPEARSGAQLAAGLGFDPQKQLQDSLYGTVGNTGSAFSLMLLIAALEEAKPGDKLLVASYGDGCDALLLQVTEEIEKVRRGRRGIQCYLENRKPLTNYEKYLKFRGLLKKDQRQLPNNPFLLWREGKQNVSLYGSRCLACSDVQFPQRQVCYKCGHPEMEEAKLSRTGKVFTFASERAMQSPDLPQVNVVLDFDSGGRLLSQMTDCDPQEIKIGMPVEVSFRRFYEGDHLYNYFWKAKPVVQS